MSILDWFRSKQAQEGVHAEEKRTSESAGWTYRLNDDACHNANRDIIAGLEFIATLRIRTPLSVLEHHGELFHGPPSKAPHYGMQADGMWVPKTKSWKELGIRLRELPESVHASDVGLVKPSEYLPFLVAFRTIVEDTVDMDVKQEKLRQLRDVSPQYTGFWEKLTQYYKDFPDSFFYLEMTAVPGIGATTARNLYAAGITCLADLRNASEDQIASVPGVGKTTLRKIKDYLRTSR